jgi:hypothetical protein
MINMKYLLINGKHPSTNCKISIDNEDISTETAGDIHRHNNKFSWTRIYHPQTNHEISTDNQEIFIEQKISTDKQELFANK